MERKVVPAALMAQVVGHDPQLQLPTHPRVPTGLVLVPMRDGLLVEGAPERQLLRGRAATTLLPRLLPLLDGSRDAKDIVELLPDVPEEAVHNAIALLYMRGLLQEGPDVKHFEDHGVPREVLAFLDRHVDMTRVNRSVQAAANRLATAHLVIAGDPRSAGLLRTELAAMGLARVAVWDGNTMPEQTSLCIVLSSGHEDPAFLAILDAYCINHGIPWLRTICTRDFLEIGPYFEPPETCCYACYVSAQNPAAGASPPIPAQEAVWISLVATEVLYLVSRIAPSVSVNSVFHMTVPDWAQVRLRPLKRPGCPVCCAAPVCASDSISPAVAYEQLVAFPSRRWLNPKSHQVHYTIASHELQSESKRYPSAECLELPPPRSLPSHTPTQAGFPAPPSGGLDLATLAGLLEWSGGIREVSQVKVQRWAPTGGNLGSVQIYVVTAGLEGLPAGTYFYQPFERSLIQLPSVPQPPDRFLQAAPGESGGLPPSAMVVLTGALHRVMRKYGPFAYKVINLDAGCAVAQMQAVADGYGLSCSPIPRWNDELLSEALGLHPDEEPITAVLTLTA